MLQCDARHARRSRVGGEQIALPQRPDHLTLSAVADRPIAPARRRTRVAAQRVRRRFGRPGDGQHAVCPPQRAQFFGGGAHRVIESVGLGELLVE